MMSAHWILSSNTWFQRAPSRMVSMLVARSSQGCPRQGSGSTCCSWLCVQAAPPSPSAETRTPPPGCPSAECPREAPSQAAPPLPTCTPLTRALSPRAAAPANSPRGPPRPSWAGAPAPQSCSSPSPAARLPGAAATTCSHHRHLLCSPLHKVSRTELFKEANGRTAVYSLNVFWTQGDLSYQ